MKWVIFLFIAFQKLGKIILAVFGQRNLFPIGEYDSRYLLGELIYKIHVDNNLSVAAKEFILWQPLFHIGKRVMGASYFALGTHINVHLSVLRYAVNDGIALYSFLINTGFNLNITMSFFHGCWI